MLERPPGVANLIATPDEARKLAAAIRAHAPAVVDPDFQLQDIQELAMVNGQYRTSIIVDPADGQMPFTQAGLDLAAKVEARNETFDDHDQRPLAERCLENLEGNYSLPNILRGGQAEAARIAAEPQTPR